MAYPTWALSVDLTLSALSVVGGLAIVVAYFYAPQKHHLRFKLLLGLGLTDFVQATTTLVGTALVLAGHPYVPDSSSCLASGFVYQATVICNACWTLAITLVTYLTLLHPLSKPTSLLESRYAFPLIAGTCVGLAIAPSIVLTIVYRMEDSAGVCFLPSTSLASKLELFIPRAAVLIIVIVLYIRMFIFFRRRDMHLLDSSSNSNDADSRHPQEKRLSFRRFTSSKNRVSSRPTSQRSTSGVQAVDSPDRRLSVIPASPAPDAVVVDKDDGDGFDPRPQFGKDSAATVSLSEHEDAPPRMGLSPSAVTLETRPALGTGGPSSLSVPRLSKQNTPNFPPATAEGDPPRNIPLSPRQLNKRLSLLMACYPIAYSVLVAISLARLIQQFVTGRRADRGLLFVSRFFIFSQGAVDGILYFAIQAAFRHWNRKGRRARTGA
ncbi:hypothetical protein JCM3774_000081 [Rhodotorula dairenensis]